MNYVGKKLKEIRRKNNLTQESLAEILNTNRARISKIENGKMDLTFNEAIKICEKFHISADSFFEITNLSSSDTFQFLVDTLKIKMFLIQKEEKCYEKYI